MILYIPLLVYCQIKDFVELCDFEISGLGKISEYKNGFIIEKIKLIEQEVTASNTKLDAIGLGKLYHEILQEEGTLSSWKLWWHSHASMKTFWSGIDEDTISEFDNETPNNNWMISAVFNHKMDWKGRLDVFHPRQLTYGFTDLRIVQIYSRDIRSDCRSQIDQKVKEKQYFIPKKKIKLPVKLPLIKDAFHPFLPSLDRGSTPYQPDVDML